MELNGTSNESPMLTHRWNNVRLTADQTFFLSPGLCVESFGDPSAWRLTGLLRHMPVIGWQRYLVIQPESDRPWYIGWVYHGGAGISRIRLEGAARVLEGPGRVFFFGIDAETQEQLLVDRIGKGRLGDKSAYADLPLI